MALELLFVYLMLIIVYGVWKDYREKEQQAREEELRELDKFKRK